MHRYQHKRVPIASYYSKETSAEVKSNLITAIKTKYIEVPIGVTECVRLLSNNKK